MGMNTIALTTWSLTCKVCEQIRNMLGVALITCIAFTESAGRARAANQLLQMGYVEEAKRVMLENEYESNYN